MEITSQQIMEPRHFPLVSKTVLIIGGIFAITIIGLPIAVFVVLGSCLLNLLKDKKNAEQIKKQADVAFRKYIGKPVKYCDVGTAVLGNRKATGTGVAYDNQTLYILDCGVAATIPLTAVREWKWCIDGYETVSLYGDINDADRLKSTMSNINAKYEAYKNSGLFVSVESISHPEWQFMTDDKQILKRWMEILRQATEGKI
jgi:hypothetical protein